MAADKITVTWDDLNDPRVDEKLKRQDTLRETQQHYQSAPAPELLLRHQRTSLWYNSLVYMAIFGLIGGLLGWGVGELFHLRPDLRAQARELIDNENEILRGARRGELTKVEADAALAELRHAGRDNAYFQIQDDTSATDKDAAMAHVDAEERLKTFISDVLFYGVCGLMISLALATAEPLVERNYQHAILNGCVGALLGLVGGVVVALFVDRLYQAMLGHRLDAPANLGRQMLARAVSWGILGLFLSLAPGIVLRNGKRLAVGMAGGLLGGIIGGILFEPIARLTHEQHVSRLIAVVAIGLIAGLGTGIFENAAKTGWLKVAAGLIAGKQFVLYRNPTYLGSSPHCQVYLFKDPQIGRRHAAVHIVGGRFELENLPLGGPTLLNNAPVTRAKLKAGDQIQIGSFRFIFQEKVRT